MSKKKKRVVIGMICFLFVIGFVNLLISACIQHKTDRLIADILGMSFFPIALLSLALLFKYSSKIILSEMIENLKIMNNDVNFFSRININENPQSLEKRFLNMGFEIKQGYLYKRQFDFWKKHINTYVIIVNDELITEYFNIALNKIDKLLHDKYLQKEYTIVYLLFFNRNITNDELELFKYAIIKQDLSFGFCYGMHIILPIAYDTATQEYIIRTQKTKFSIILFHIALRRFYAILDIKDRANGFSSK